MPDLPAGLLIPFSDEQWARFYAAKDGNGSYMGYVYLDGKWCKLEREDDSDA